MKIAFKKNAKTSGRNFNRQAYIPVDKESASILQLKYPP